MCHTLRDLHRRTKPTTTWNVIYGTKFCLSTTKSRDRYEVKLISLQTAAEPIRRKSFFIRCCVQWPNQISESHVKGGPRLLPHPYSPGSRAPVPSHHVRVRIILRKLNCLRLFASETHAQRNLRIGMFPHWPPGDLVTS